MKQTSQQLRHGYSNEELCSMNIRNIAGIGHIA